ncbi:helix-turn-helix transcriptional regulator [bacterium]|nr:helix-turn-helix transcriptional regulator [bacterium]
MGNFTKREIEVLYQLLLAKENKEISKKLCISEHTTKAHLASIYKKLGVTNRMQATLKCFMLLTKHQFKQQDLEKIFQ